MKAEKFHELYKSLNVRQKEAVDAIDGPVMVIAGPGTGKTQILTLRIANILQKTDIKPENILALTFTEAATANMRRRLVSIIGTPGYYVRISTFHGFCNRVIQDYPEHFETIIGSRNAAENDRIEIVREILERGDFEKIKPFGDSFFYVLDILKAIRDLKNEGIDAVAFRNILKKERERFEAAPDLYHEKGAHKGKMKTEYQKELTRLEKNEELLKVYEEYQTKLREKKLYDFEDMILEVIQALEKKENLLQELQESYQYMLVDEHQDTNGAQNRILELLCSFFDNPNLFVVGDEKQAIFRFQGASLSNFLYFKDAYSGVRLIDLQENYRSTQAILDSAQSLIEKNRAIISKPIRSFKHRQGEKIKVIAFDTPEDEYLFLARSVREAIQGGVTPHEIAILYRENNDVFPVSLVFDKSEIPYVVESDQNVLEDEDIRKLLLTFETVYYFGQDEKLAAFLHIDFLDLDPLDVYLLLKRAQEKRTSLFKLLRSEEQLRLSGVEHPEAYLALYAKLKEWKRRSENEHFLRFFERAVQESGFLQYILSGGGATRRLAKLRTLFEETKKIAQSHVDYSLRDFIRYLTIVREHGVSIRSKMMRVADSVRFMTAHRAKGLEFDLVFIIGAYDGHWGNKRAFQHFKLPLRTSVPLGELERNEDERRLFYMAITRARYRVCVTYALQSTDGREQVPSQFIGEIHDELKEVTRYEMDSSDILTRQTIMFTPSASSGPATKEEEFVKSLFTERGLSVTALNNYLTCPWKYFYNNLIRIPKAMTKTQMYGIAVHGALKDFFDTRRNNVSVNAEFLIKRFRLHLERQPIALREFEVVFAKGSGVLTSYHERYAGEWSYKTISEYNVPGIELAEGIKITGKLDKLELQSNASDVIVVDYKVKQPESRNWIEGKTANSTGDYKRQLVFYKLLLNLKPGARQRMMAGVIDFVEPNERGIFKKESFEITEGETLELKAEIVRVADEILNLKFWDVRCGEKSCEYCRLRDMMK